MTPLTVSAISAPTSTDPNEPAASAPASGPSSGVVIRVLPVACPSRPISAATAAPPANVTASSQDGSGSSRSRYSTPASTSGTGKMARASPSAVGAGPPCTTMARAITAIRQRAAKPARKPVGTRPGGRVSAAGPGGSVEAMSGSVTGGRRGGTTPQYRDVSVRSAPAGRPGGQPARNGSSTGASASGAT